ncbi:MAG: CsgG/HfaB family protein [Bacteroidota bacterium]|jgi:curli biogenesis system outer membrane secretion channel CsgG
MKKLLFLILMGISFLSAQNKFYNYYTAGIEYMQKQDWQRAIVEFKSAASLEFEDVQRKRTYGTRFIEYYPHRETGVAHYMLGENDLAKKEIALSLAYRSTDRAEDFYKKITGGVAPPPAKTIEEQITGQTITQYKSPTITAPQKQSTSYKNNIIVITRKYDPNAVPQVGSRLSIAVLPFEGKGESAKFKDAVTNKLINELVNSRRFRVIERSAMDKIIAEQKVQASGVVDDKTAVGLGKIAGADALVIGTVSMVDSSIEISVRLVDVETAETIVAQDANSENTTQGEIDNTVRNVATLVFNELPIIEGDIIKVDADELFIDIGSLNGVKRGTKCVVFREGESIKHPISGEILGKKVTRLGEIIVIQVNDKFAAVKPIETDQDIHVGDKVIIK